ncbi:MAG: acyloxyacyl hydrolase [Pseudomonadota bacterium]
MRILKSLMAAGAVSSVALSSILALSAPAIAADSGTGTNTGKNIVSEVRLGLYDHESELFGDRYETSDPDVNVEILFNAPDWLAWMANPRLNIGADINTGSGTSIGYGGLVWTYDVTDALFIEGAFGGAIHDGETDRPTADQMDLGCRVMFHESASIGYRVSDNTSVMVTVDHMSNAGLCSSNPGITNAGVRLGYTF